jgi:hypothetical protein
MIRTEAVTEIPSTFLSIAASFLVMINASSAPVTGA